MPSRRTHRRSHRRTLRSRSKCAKALSRKIKINTHEPRYKSRKQAIAVSYSQVLKKHPNCSRSLRRKSTK